MNLLELINKHFTFQVFFHTVKIYFMKEVIIDTNLNKVCWEERRKADEMFFMDSPLFSPRFLLFVLLKKVPRFFFDFFPFFFFLENIHRFSSIIIVVCQFNLQRQDDLQVQKQITQKNIFDMSTTVKTYYQCSNILGTRQRTFLGVRVKGNNFNEPRKFRKSQSLCFSQYYSFS